MAFFDFDLKLSCNVVKEIEVLDIPQPIVDLIRTQAIKTKVEADGFFYSLSGLDTSLINMVKYDGSEPELNPIFENLKFGDSIK